MLKAETEIICSRLAKVTMAITRSCVIASLIHVVVLSLERYLAIKHSFAYENLVTEVRIIVASGLAWAVAIIFLIEYFWPGNVQYVRILAAACYFPVYLF